MPFIVGNVPQGFADVLLHRPGVVYQHVNPVEPGQGGLDQPIDLAGVGYVGGDGQSFPADGFDLSGCGVDGALAAPGNDQVGPGAGEGPHHRQAQSGAASSDDDDFAVQAQTFKHFLFNLENRLVLLASNRLRSKYMDSRLRGNDGFGMTHVLR